MLGSNTTKKQAYEAIQVAIPEVESAEETGVRLATHGKGNYVAYSHLMEHALKVLRLV